MKKSHKIISIIIFLFVFVFSYYARFPVTTTVVQLLVTFFSIAFGFFITSIAILYNSSYLKELYNYIDKKNQKRGIHILIIYFRTSIYWSFISIGTIVLYSLLINIDNLKETQVIFIGYDIQNVISSLVLSISCVNALFIFLLVNVILNGMSHEAKSNP